MGYTLILKSRFRSHIIFKFATLEGLNVNVKKAKQLGLNIIDKMAWTEELGWISLSDLN